MERLNYMNDRLLLDSINSENNFITANNLLPNKKEIIILPNNTLNLYTALVKRIDFTLRKLVGAIPFFLMKTEDILEFLPSSYKSDFYWKLRKIFSFYNNRKRIGRTESFRLWFKKESFPLTLIRIIANISSSNKEEELELLSELIQKVNFINNFQSAGNIYIPKKFRELYDEDLAYFVGCSFGDGELNIAEHWQLVDGDPKNIEATLEFIENLKVIANKLFSLKFTVNNPRLRGNKYEFWIANKNLCRFLNFFFGMPYGEKKNRMTRPKIFDLLPNRKNLTKIFWKGMFDTDGCLEKNGYRITLASATDEIVNDCKKDFMEFGINSKIRTIDSTGVKLLNLDRTSFKTFGVEIGFSHPRKLKTYNNKLMRYNSKFSEAVYYTDA